MLVISASSFSQGVPKTKDPNYANQPMMQANSMRGAYTMLSQKVKINGEDSLINNKQLKIYTDKYFMYAFSSPEDTTGGFGIGTYSIQNGKVIESPLYTTFSGSRPGRFEVEVAKRTDGFSQVVNIPSNDGGESFLLSEEYQQSSRNMTSVLDGAWKLIKATTYPPGGNPAVRIDRIQFKLYQSGYYMWGYTETDPATQKPSSGFGYGYYQTAGPRQITETALNSTYRSMLIGNPINLKLELKGENKYIQTIVWPDGTKTVEEYDRLK